MQVVPTVVFKLFLPQWIVLQVLHRLVVQVDCLLQTLDLSLLDFQRFVPEVAGRKLDVEVQLQEPQIGSELVQFAHKGVELVELLQLVQGFLVLVLFEVSHEVEVREIIFAQVAVEPQFVVFFGIVELETMVRVFEVIINEGGADSVDVV